MTMIITFLSKLIALIQTITISAIAWRFGAGIRPRAKEERLNKPLNLAQEEAA
ncbi:hypothetical protein [Lacticaseibacillus hegangensis]|uniref:Uncharacterized protein n=1 Tax=Lacticaseibacillus hegangensis TaxID=2486010 RepID=A0ABW4CTP3_9LACO|nr:hypothetical protein [Lacticaseibacillus hegangensis]